MKTLWTKLHTLSSRIGSAGGGSCELKGVICVGASVNEEKYLNFYLYFYNFFHVITVLGPVYLSINAFLTGKIALNIDEID